MAASASAALLRDPHRHVALARGALAAGSLRMSLKVARDALLVQAAAHVVRSLDTDMNLDLCTAADAAGWWALAERLLPPAEIAETAVLDGSMVVA